MRWGLAAMLTIAAATPTLAEGLLPIAGAFGNASGCAFFMTGAVLDEDLLILTPDNFTAHAASCHFERLIAQTAGTFRLAASCRERDNAGPEQIAVRAAAEGGYTVTVVGAEMQWGPLIACPGADAAFQPLGERV